LEIAVIGYIPGVPSQPELLRRILMFQLAPAIVLSLLLTFLSGFAHDIEVRRSA
jgi:predicted secreted protein